MATTNREITEDNLSAKLTELNDLFTAIQTFKREHPEGRIGYYTASTGSILNAYREGDLGFDEAIAALDAKAAVPAGALKTDREAWLLSEVSSTTRSTIGVEQYEELRALANRLAHTVKEMEDHEQDLIWAAGG